LVAADPSRRQVAAYRRLVTQRAARVPLQHLVGTAPFRHRELRVGPGVFVPRPETEQVVMWGLSWLRVQGLEKAKIVDLCSGSGAIAVAVATEKQGTEVWAVEVDPAALVWLERNAGGHGVNVVAGDATDPAVLAELDGTVDLVLSNPPYVPDVGQAGLPPEVSEHDPPVAVFGGTDGLDVIRPLIGRIAALLRPGGAVALEHDDTHAYVVPTLIGGDGRFTGIELHHDLARRPRFTTATRAAAAERVADWPS
jgi:release factor glutamine methyltransferase